MNCGLLGESPVFVWSIHLLHLLQMGTFSLFVQCHLMQIGLHCSSWKPSAEKNVFVLFLQSGNENSVFDFSVLSLEQNLEDMEEKTFQIKHLAKGRLFSDCPRLHTLKNFKLLDSNWQPLLALFFTCLLTYPSLCLWLVIKDTKNPFGLCRTLGRLSIKGHKN